MQHQVYYVPEKSLAAAINQLAADGWDVVACWPARETARWGFWMQAERELAVLARRPQRSGPLPEGPEAAE